MKHLEYSALALILFCISCVSCSIEHGLNDDPDWEKYDYAITSTSSIRNLGCLLEDKGLGNMADDFKGAVEFYNKKVDVINFDYPSVGPDGKKLTLSARMYVMDLQTKWYKKTPYVALANHASIVEADQCPTKDWKAEALFAWFGCPVVMPDYYGFGSSEQYPQAYLNSQLAARNNVDALKSAIQILKDKNIKVGDEYYNVGYSQGGFNTIANLKYVTEHPECGIKFKCSFAGAGSYDINASWDEYMKDNYPAAAVFLPLTLVSANECGKLGFDYKNIFKEPLASHVDEWILAKKYSFGKIMDKIGSDKIADILMPGMIDGTSREYETYRELFEGYSVSKSWKSMSGTKVLLFHSRQDDVVPYFNSELLYEELRKAGANVKLVSGDFGGHTDAELDFAQAIIDEL